jgi:ABC-2 type transport system permease protein
MRILLTLRNKTFLFFIVLMPLGFFFLYSSVFAKGVPQVVKFFLGPVIALNVMGGFWGLSAALVTYREQGILRRFHVTPVKASDMLASSVAANFVLTVPIVVLELLLARYLFHVQGIGNWIALAGLGAIGIVSFAAMGLVVASVTNTMQETQVINQLIWFPLIFLSGATFPFGLLPKLVQKVAVFLPATYLVTGLQRAIMTPASIWSFRVEATSLGLWAVLAFFVSAQLFRWEPEQKVTRNAKLYALATVIPFVLLGIWEIGYGGIQRQAQSAYQSLSQPSSSARTR